MNEEDYDGFRAVLQASAVIGSNNVLDCSFRFAGNVTDLTSCMCSLLTRTYREIYMRSTADGERYRSTMTSLILTGKVFTLGSIDDVHAADEVSDNLN